MLTGNTVTKKEEGLGLESKRWVEHFLQNLGQSYPLAFDRCKMDSVLHSRFENKSQFT